MSPLGSYPDTSVHLGSSVLVIDPDICFSVTRLKGEDWSFSEVDSLTPLEIPLLGSAMLCSCIEDRYIFPYPASVSLTLHTETDQEINEECVSECRTFLLKALNDYRNERFFRASKVHDPPAMGGLQYELESSRDIGHRTRQLFTHLETAGPVMIRGVSSLLKANMAWRHAEFWEAACICLWIALDGAYSLTLDKLTLPSECVSHIR